MKATTLQNTPVLLVVVTAARVVADGMTEVSFRRLTALVCLYWQVNLRWGKKNKIVVVGKRSELGAIALHSVTVVYLLLNNSPASTSC